MALWTSQFCCAGTYPEDDSCWQCERLQSDSPPPVFRVEVWRSQRGNYYLAANHREKQEVWVSNYDADSFRVAINGAHRWLAGGERFGVEDAYTWVRRNRLPRDATRLTSLDWLAYLPMS